MESQIREFLDSLGNRDDFDWVNSPLDEIRKANAQLELQFDVRETAMYQERELEITGPNGSVPLRIYWPRKLQRDERSPIMIFMHGGAWVLCSMDTHENMCRYLCSEGDVIGINVGYRLAPEHKFPAGIVDCDSVLRWTAANANILGGDPARICVAGDSAGGNIAAVLSLMSRDRGEPGIAAQLLIYPSVAMGVLPRFESWEKYCSGEYGLTEAGINVMLGHYLNSPDELLDYRVSPLLAKDHSNQPPTLIITAELDPLRDEAAAYVEKLRQAGGQVDYRCFEGTIHAFMSMAGAMSVGYEGLDYAAGFLRRTLR